MLNTYNDIVKHLDNLGMFHMKPGQDRMSIALENLNLLPLPYKAVQIVGTNGKGSTATFLSSLAHEHGLNVGLYTSPHFLSIKERILYNSEQLSDDIWLEAAKKVYTANPELTYFEFLTVLSAQIYADLQADIVFFEAGLGGKFDATTALQAQATVFTSIALDHCDILGDTIQKIAHDKARAMNTWTKFAVTAKLAPEALAEVENISKQFDIPLFFSSYDNVQFELFMKGTHQPQNAQLALDTWHLVCEKLLHIKPDIKKEQLALKKAFIPGRIQFIDTINTYKNTRFILDGAHNVHGLQALIESLKTMCITPKYIIFSCLSDKANDDLFSCLDELAKLSSSHSTLLIPTISDNPRAIDSSKLAKKLENSSFSSIIPLKNLDECLEYVQNANNERQISTDILICGSLYLLSEFYAKYSTSLSKA